MNRSKISVNDYSCLHLFTDPRTFNRKGVGTLGCETLHKPWFV